MNLVLRLFCTLIPMTLMHVFLHATGPVLVFQVFLAAGCCIPVLPLPHERYASRAFFALGAFIGLGLIIIQPLSGFLIWFDLVDQGAMRGPVSVVFMFLGGYLSLAASYSIGPGMHLRSFVQVLSTNILLCFIIYRVWWLLALAGVLLPLLVITILSGNPPPRYKRRGIATLAGLLVLAVLLALAFAPGQPPAGIHLIDEYLSGYLRDAVYRFLPEFPVLYGFSGYGHGFPEAKLGGRPLLSERALFAIEGRPGSSYYFRTRSFDTFTGTGWASSLPDSGDAFQGSLSRTGADDGYLSGNPAGSLHTLVRLHLLMDYFPLVPQILGAATVLPGRSGDGLRYAGSPAAGLILARPLVYGERLLVGRAAESSREASSVSIPDPADDPELYRSIPEAIPPIALELAALLQGLPEDSVPGALAGLLDDGFTYSLDPADQTVKEKPGNGTDPVESGFLQHFLAVSRTGYCVHFATAAVLLARLAGVPARYVTGFLVSIPQPEEDLLETGSGGLVRTELTGLNSHAWAELWFPSTGWISFEATPPLRQETAEAGATRAPAAAMDDFTLRQLAAITGGRMDLREPGRAGPVGTLTPARLALMMLLPGLALFSGWFLYRLARQSGWHPEDWTSWWIETCVSWRTGTPGLRLFRFKARRIVRLAAALGVPGPERSGWLAWEEGLAGLLARHGIDLDGSGLCRANLAVFRDTFFGCRLPDRSDFICLDKLSRLLRRMA